MLFKLLSAIISEESGYRDGSRYTSVVPSVSCSSSRVEAKALPSSLDSMFYLSTAGAMQSIGYEGNKPLEESFLLLFWLFSLFIGLVFLGACEG